MKLFAEISIASAVQSDPIRSTKNIVWKNRDFKPSALVLCSFSKNFRKGGVDVDTLPSIKPSSMMVTVNTMRKTVAQTSNAQKARIREDYQALYAKYGIEDLDCPDSVKREITRGCPTFMRDSFIMRIRGGEKWSCEMIRTAKKNGSIRAVALQHGLRPVFK